MKHLFWANIIIYIFTTPLLPELLLNIPYIDAQGGHTAFDISLFLKPISLMLIAAPFLIVCHKQRVISALINSVKIIARNAGRFLPIFLSGSLLVSILPFISGILFDQQFPYTPVQKIIILFTISFNTSISCIVAIVFYQAFERAIKDEGQFVGEKGNPSP